MMFNPIEIDMNLMTMLINSWEEDSRTRPGETITRAWIGYPMEIVDELISNGDIVRKADSIIFTDKGKERAERLKRLHC